MRMPRVLDRNRGGPGSPGNPEERGGFYVWWPNRTRTKFACWARCRSGGSMSLKTSERPLIEETHEGESDASCLANRAGRHSSHQRATW